MGNKRALAAFLGFIALTVGGCATKQEVTALHGDMAVVRNEWTAFERGYDPSMREELRENLQVLQRLNDEVARLRDEVAFKSARVSELLAQIDNNELDRAVQECALLRADAEHFALNAQHYSDIALSYAESARQEARLALKRHTEQYHRVGDEELLRRIRHLENALQNLERQDERAEKEENGKRPKKPDAR